jgi:DNA polymerase-3 subunit gamma/tau
MFYTKYRPQKFSDISKPNKAADALAAQVAKKKTGHAYLFVGPRGTGKTTAARILAKALNCEKISKKGDPCDECMVCESIKKGTFIDLIEIDAASNRGIDDIRELKNKVKLAPSSGKNKVYIIDEVHMLTNEAFNALLKTLEEPPARTTFILCTTEFNKVPDTIKSRCQVFKFKRGTLTQLSAKLRIIADEEGIEITDTDLKKISKASLGGFRDAETLLQQVSDGDIDIDALLNIGSKENFLDFVEFMIEGDHIGALDFINKIYDDGIDVYIWSGELLKYLRELIYIVSGSQVPNYDITEDLDEQVNTQASKIDLDWLVETLEVFIEAHSKVKASFLPQLPIEIAIVKVTNGALKDETNENEQGNNVKSASTIAVKKGADKSETKAETKPTKRNKKYTMTKRDEEYTIKLEKNKKIEKKLKMQEKNKNTKTGSKKKSASKSLDVTVSNVKEKWEDLLINMAKVNSSILALLKASNPFEVQGEYLVLEVYYLFHKERLESPKNRRLVEDQLSQLVFPGLKFKCKLSAKKPKKLKKNETGVLTDYNLAPSVKNFDKEVVIDMLDGGLPM